MKKLILIVTILSFAFYPCAVSATNNGEIKQVNFQLDWKAGPDYAAIYIAKEKGYYTEVGINLNIIEGNGAANAAQIIGNSKNQYIGLCNGAVTAISVSKKIPIQSLGVYYPETATVIYSLGKNPVKRPEDLYGKTIGLIQGTLVVDEFKTLVRVNKLDTEKIKKVSVGWDATPLLANKVDALMTYESNLPILLKLQGYNVENLRLREYGVNLYSLNIIANKEMIEKDPETIRSIVDATNKGYEFVRKHPEESAKIFMELFPEKDAKYIKESLYVVGELTGSNTVGKQTIEGWEKTIETLQKLELLDSRLEASQIVPAKYLMH